MFTRFIVKLYLHTYIFTLIANKTRITHYINIVSCLAAALVSFLTAASVSRMTDASVFRLAIALPPFWMATLVAVALLKVSLWVSTFPGREWLRRDTLRASTGTGLTVAGGPLNNASLC